MRAFLTSTLMAQRPMARTALRTKSTSTSVAYSFSSASTWKWQRTTVTHTASVHNTTPRMYIKQHEFVIQFNWFCSSLMPLLKPKKLNLQLTISKMIWTVQRLLGIHSGTCKKDNMFKSLIGSSPESPNTSIFHSLQSCTHEKYC